MLEVLIATAIGAYAAPECQVAFERRGETRLVLRLRPACPIGRGSTEGAVRALLHRSGDAAEISLAFGRIVLYPWLSEALARQASSSRHWDPRGGPGKDNRYVAAALRGMPEFTALFPGWQVAGVSVEKVLVKRAAELPLPAGAPIPPSRRLPYDAILWVTLKRP